MVDSPQDERRGGDANNLGCVEGHDEKLKDKEPLTLPEYLADEGHSPSLIATILETGHEEETGEEE
jgi:hypothetical protein